MKLFFCVILCVAALSAAEKAPNQQKSKSQAVAIEISLGKLVEAQASLGKIFNLNLPVQTAWAMRKTVATVEAELKRFEDQRVALVKKYSEKQADGTIVVTAENQNAFSVDYKTLTDIIVNLMIVPISLPSLGDDAKLSPMDMARLEKFLTE